MNPPRPKSALLLSLPVFAVALVYVAIEAAWLHPSLRTLALTGVALSFSPLPISVAAVLMDTERNSMVPHVRGTRRAFTLYPALLRSKWRQETLYHLAGFAVCVAAVLL